MTSRIGQAAIVVVVVVGAVAVYLRSRPVDVADMELKRFERPGFAITLPDGKVESDDRATGFGGRYKLLEPGGRGGVIELSWERGLPLTPEELGAVRDALLAAPEMLSVETEKTTESEGKRIVYWLIRIAAPKSSDAVMAMSFIHCTDTRVTVNVGTLLVGSRTDTIELHARVVDSIECLPVEESLEQTTSLPDIDLPDGVGYIPGSDPPQFESESVVLVVVVTPGDLVKTLQQRPEVLWQAIEGTGYMKLSDRDQRPARRQALNSTDAYVLTADNQVEGARVPLAVSLFYCSVMKSTVMVIAMGPATRDEVVAIALRAGCPRAAPPGPSDFPVADQAFIEAYNATE